MHEFLLFGQVANDDQHKLLQQLAGVTRMQPQHVLERHLVFKARPPVGLGNIPSGGGSQGVLPAEVQRTKQMLTSSIFYLQLVCTSKPVEAVVKDDHSALNGTVNGDAAKNPSTVNGGAKDPPKQAEDQWAIEFRDIPDPGKQSVTTRLMSRTPVEAGDMAPFVRDLGFEYVSQFILEGHKVYDQDITLFLHQVLTVPQTPIEEATSTGTYLPDISNLQPLDGGKSFVLQASIEAIDGNNLEVKEKAVQQLMAMKDTLKQAVTLAPGDRLALDTRVPMRNRP